MIDESPIKDDLFFDRFSNTARAVLVDSEPKVIKNILNDKKINYVFNHKNMLYSQNGRGNNWALGYSSSYKETTQQVGGEKEAKPLFERTME